MKPYGPSNGTEGAEFEAQFCDRCKRLELLRKIIKKGDKTVGELSDAECEIHSRAVFFEVCEEEYPREWVSDDDGLNPKCTAFEEC